MSKSQKKRRLEMFNSRRDSIQVLSNVLPNLLAKPVAEWNPVIDIPKDDNPIELVKHQRRKVEVVKRPSGFKVQYDAHITSKAWKEIKQKYRADTSRYQKCWVCAVPHTISPHHFHHLHYNSLGHETLNDIIPVCVPCHDKIHKNHKPNGTKTLKQFTMEMCSGTKQERKILTPNAS